MSEANMTLRGSDKRQKLGSGTLVEKAYEPYFLEELDPAIPWLAKRGVKIAVNAGASDVQGLADAVRDLVKKHGVDLKVAYVDGDDVTDAVLVLLILQQQLYCTVGCAHISKIKSISAKWHQACRQLLPFLS